MPSTCRRLRCKEGQADLELPSYTQYWNSAKEGLFRHGGVY